MVMFKEDEARMIAAERAAEPRWKKIMRRTLKIGFTIAFVFGGSLVILSSLGGNSETLKKGVEQYLQQATGFEARVDTLQGMAFFPVVGVAFDDLTLYYPAPGPADTKPDDKNAPAPHGPRTVTVGHAVVAMGFWDMFFARRALRKLDIENLVVEQSVLNRDIKIDSLSLDPKGWKGGPAIVLKGNYDGDKATAALEVKEDDGTFRLSDAAHFTLSIGSFQAEGTVGNKPGKGMLITVDRAGPADKPLTGEIIMDRGGGVHFTARADLHIGRSEMKLDLQQEKIDPFNGTIDFPVLDMADVGSFLNAIADIFGRLPIHAEVGEKLLQAKLTVQALQDKGKTIGHFSAQAGQTGSVFTVSQIDGAMDGGALDAYTDNAMLNIKTGGFTLSLPYKGPAAVQCVAFHFSTGKGDALTADPLIMDSAGSRRLEGKGRIDPVSRVAEFTLSPAPANDRWSCLPP